MVAAVTLEKKTLEFPDFAPALRDGTRRERVRHELLGERDLYAKKLEMELTAAKVAYAQLATDYDVHLGSVIRSAKTARER